MNHQKRHEFLTICVFLVRLHNFNINFDKDITQRINFNTHLPSEWMFVFIKLHNLRFKSVKNKQLKLSKIHYFVYFADCGFRYLTPNLEIIYFNAYVHKNSPELLLDFTCYTRRFVKITWTVQTRIPA